MSDPAEALNRLVGFIEQQRSEARHAALNEVLEKVQTLIRGAVPGQRMTALAEVRSLITVAMEAS